MTHSSVNNYVVFFQQYVFKSYGISNFHMNPPYIAMADEIQPSAFSNSRFSLYCCCLLFISNRIQRCQSLLGHEKWHVLKAFSRMVNKSKGSISQAGDFFFFQKC